MKTITIYRAYRKAVVKAQFASERSKRQRMRKLRYGRQNRYFEARLIARIEEGDEARDRIRRGDFDKYDYARDDFNFDCARERAYFDPPSRW